MRFSLKSLSIGFTLQFATLNRIQDWFEKKALLLLGIILSLISAASFFVFYQNGLGIAYNDARSHLDIARRVVENLKPGVAQLGSVWLPLPHILMIATVWNDFMWHSGLAGALQSMLAYIGTGLIVYLFLKHLRVGMIGRLAGVFIFAANLNILYMQSTAMTELLLLGTMTAGVYELLVWYENEQIIHLIYAGFWILLSTLIRYDGWFLLIFSTCIMVLYIWKKYGYKKTEGIFVLFLTLAGFGLVLWLLWNQMIFKDALYFINGPYSAREQQLQLKRAGALPTEGNFLLSLIIYLYALVYNSGALTLFLGATGAVILWFDKNIKVKTKLALAALLAPFFFNVLALYMGQSVLYVQGISGKSWFNVRYGLMMLPSLAIFIGYLVQRLKLLRFALIGLLLFVTFFSFTARDAVTIDDALVGSSGKNVKEVSGWLRDHATNQDGFILISVASHDAIIFSSGLPMSKFIHEGTGLYWDYATAHPDRWARWIIMRTHDTNDLTFKLIHTNPAMNKYILIHHFPFADIYEIKPQYLSDLHTKPVLAQQK